MIDTYDYSDTYFKTRAVLIDHWWKKYLDAETFTSTNNNETIYLDIQFKKPSLLRRIFIEIQVAYILFVWKCKRFINGY